MTDVTNRRGHIHLVSGAVFPAGGSLSFPSEVLHQSACRGRHQVPVLSRVLVIHKRPGRPLPPCRFEGEARDFTSLHVHHVQRRRLTEHGLVLPVGIDIHLHRATLQQRGGQGLGPHRSPIVLRCNKRLGLQTQGHFRRGPVVPHPSHNAVLRGAKVDGNRIWRGPDFVHLVWSLRDPNHHPIFHRRSRPSGRRGLTRALVFEDLPCPTGRAVHNDIAPLPADGPSAGCCQGLKVFTPLGVEVPSAPAFPTRSPSGHSNACLAQGQVQGGEVGGGFSEAARPPITRNPGAPRREQSGAHRRIVLAAPHVQFWPKQHPLTLELPTKIRPTQRRPLFSFAPTRCHLPWAFLPTGQRCF